MLSVIEFGYSLPLFTIPSSVEKNNNKYAKDNERFV